MLLTSIDGQSVEITITSYQFPDHGPDPGIPVRHPARHYDANWLIIETNIQATDEHWMFTAPCMLTYSAEQIYLWLLAIEQGTAKEVIGGGEPEIAFRLLERDSSKAKLVFDYMRWEKADRRWHHYLLPLELKYQDLKQAAAEWYSEIQRFPVRYGKSEINNNSE